MPNQQLTTTLLTMAVARGLYNTLSIAGNFDNRFQKDFQREMPVGATVYPRLPWRVTQKTGLGLQLQPLVDRVTAITMLDPIQYSVDYDSVEEALNMPRPTSSEGSGLIKQFTEPIINQMAQDIESTCALYVLKNSSNVVGSLAAAITDLATPRTAVQKMVELGGWKPGKMVGVITPAMANNWVGLGQAFFNDKETVSSQFKTMKIGRYAGVDWNQSVSLYNQTAGTAVTAITVTGANQAGGSLIITGTITQTLNDGDKIAIGSGTTAMNAVNPGTRRSQNALRVITIVGDYVLTGGADTVNITPSLVGPGSQYQNVDALPQDGAAVVLWPGTTSPSGKTGVCGALFADDAFAIVGNKLRLPKAIEHGSVQPVPGTGIDVRFTVTWDAVLSRNIARFDAQFALGPIEPENKSCLIAASA